MDPIKEDNELYIKTQKTQIDKMLDDFNYRPAFTLLVQTLSKLNEKDTKDVDQARRLGLEITNALIEYNQRCDCRSRDRSRFILKANIYYIDIQ